MSTHSSRANAAHGKTHRVPVRPPFECIALLLQGGGALGAYQAGVYEALADAHLDPDWVAGISIGAINSALIAGNPPETRLEKLRKFWELVTTTPLWGAAGQLGAKIEPVCDLVDQAIGSVASIGATSLMPLSSKPLGQHPDRFPIGSKDLYVVQHTASDYLPTTVRTYLEVPSWSVGTPTADGRTPLQMVHSQLDLLEAKLDEIAERVRSQRVDNLLANERFLEDNFGSDSKAELTIPR